MIFYLLKLLPFLLQVIFPSNFETGNGGKGLGYLPMMPASPIMHPRVKEVRTNHEGSHRRGKLNYFISKITFT